MPVEASGPLLAATRVKTTLVPVVGALLSTVTVTVRSLSAAGAALFLQAAKPMAMPVNRSTNFFIIIFLNSVTGDDSRFYQKGGVLSEGWFEYEVQSLNNVRIVQMRYLPVKKR